jgi:Cu-Zn family superoxide dismutase
VATWPSVFKKCALIHAQPVRTNSGHGIALERFNVGWGDSMKHMILVLGFGMVAAVSPAAQSGQKPTTTGTTGTSPAPMATATLTDAQGSTIGEAQLQQTPHGVLVKLELRNATPGVHALHIHEFGRCDAPSFDSAGDHFAPSGRQHGLLNPRGPHAGDLPNIDVPANRQLSVEHHITDVTLDAGPRSLLDANGSAIVIHAGKDDYTSDPAGNAGDRIACGRVLR